MSQLRLLRPRCHPAPRFPGAANSPGCVHHLCASGRGVFRSSLPGPAVQRLYYVLAILYDLLLYYDPPVLAVSTKERLSCRGRDQLVLLVSPPPASAAACCPLCLLCRLSLPLAVLAFSLPAFLSRAPPSLCSSSPALPPLSFLPSFPSASSPCFLSSFSCPPRLVGLSSSAWRPSSAAFVLASVRLARRSWVGVLVRCSVGLLPLVSAAAPCCLSWSPRRQCGGGVHGIH